MPGHRMERITEDVHRELTAIFRELKDPRAQQGMLSIVRVEVTNDLSHCNVYVSSMLGMEKCKEACVGLKSAAGFMRGELGHRLKLRHVPQRDGRAVRDKQHQQQNFRTESEMIRAHITEREILDKHIRGKKH